jgi:hypothetical protein
VNGITQVVAGRAYTPRQPGEVDMLELLAFAVVAVALATPFGVPLMWGQLEQSSQDTAAAAQDEPRIGPARRRIVTVCAALVAVSAFIQAADAQQSRRILPNDPERLRMIEECMDMMFGRSGGKEHMYHMYQACMDDHGQQ